MRSIYKSSIIAISAVLVQLFFIHASFAQAKLNPKASAGELSFTVRTVTENGNFAPRHVLAIWVEDADGFVKTRKAMANQRIQYLYTWKASSNYNVVDAITGPTLNNHQTHTVSWDCKDVNGNIVPDGEYTVFVEYTEEHAQGPLYDISFTKGSETISLSPPDETYFKDLSLTFTPLVSDFTVNNNTVCVDESIAFIDQSVNATSWLWNFGDDAVPATANTEGPHMVYYTSSGLKTVELTINGNLTETKENFISVAVSPIAEFNFSGNEYTVQFNNTSVNADSYLWDFGDGNTSIEDSPEHTYASSGTYTVSLTATYLECENMVTSQLSVPLTGIELSLTNEDFKIFPNPNGGVFSIELPVGFICKNITITDPSGSAIKEFKYLSLLSPDVMQIDLGDVAKGLYFIEVNSNQAKLTQKMIVR